MIKDSNLFKTIEIPENIRHLRFILIDKNDKNKKKPLETGWPDDKNYRYGEPRLMGWIAGGGNYAIATGFEEIAIFDADEIERLEELGIIKQLPPTFTVRTGGGGFHFYFKVRGLQQKIVLYDPERTDETGNAAHLGEILSKRNEALGPNSIHRSGKKYEVVNDVPIAELDYARLTEIIKVLKLKKSTTKTDIVQKYESDNEVPIDKIAWPAGTVRERMGSNGKEVYGEHPIHGATKREDRGKSTNFHINLKQNVWHCHAHKCGGGWIQWLAIKEGIIHCGDKMDREDYRKAFARAVELGLIEESEPEPIEPPELELDIKRQLVNELPEYPPEARVTALVGAPRNKKTHTTVRWLKNSLEGNYFTSKHSIVGHAIKVAREMGMQGVVWIVGMSQPGACRTGTKNCASCPMKPEKEGGVGWMEMKGISAKLLKEKRVLTVADVPRDLCPYYITRAAEEYARYCFTVVNNMEAVRPRDVVIIDEDPTTDAFRPASIEVATVKKVYGEVHCINNLAKLDLSEYKRKKNMKQYTDKLEEIRQIIEANSEQGPKAIASAIDVALEGWDPADASVKEEGGSGDDISMGECVRCLSHVYQEQKVDVVMRTGGYSSVYILGDESKITRGREFLDSAKKVVIIGMTKATLLAKELGGEVMELEGFPYKDRYTAILVKREGNTARIEEKKVVLDIAKKLWNDSEQECRYPFIVLTGSKRSQKNVMSAIGGSLGARVEGEGGMKWAHANGMPAVMYQNSRISRGLDVDQYNVLMAYDTNFINPFWKIADPEVAKAIVSDETTNSVLRTSPTPRNDEKMMKIIVMPYHDWWKVKYLAGREIVTDADSTTITRVIKAIGVCGEVTLTDKNGTRIRSRGVEASKGRRKVTELLKDPTMAMEEGEIEGLVSKILEIIKKTWEKTGRRTSTRDIADKMPYTKETVVKKTLEELSESGRIIAIKYGAHGKIGWEPRENFEETHSEIT